MLRERPILFQQVNAMQAQRNTMLKKIAGLVRRKLRPTQTHKDVGVVVPDEKAFGVIFAGNAETARKNLDRFAPRV